MRCILLVDDDPTARYLHRRLLERLGVAALVLEAANGQAALAVVRAQSAKEGRPGPELILLDVRMPVMDGFEFLAAYRALPQQLQGAKVVALLTVPLHPHELARAARGSVAAYLSKPLTADALRALVQDQFAAPAPVG